ncbi:PalH/RIM21, partial [Geopyxis carbonaria]
MGRQNWRETSSTTRFTVVPSCTPYTLPSGLVVPLATTETVTLTTAITVTPHCYTSPPTPTARRGGGPAADDGDSVKASDLRDPFYASTIPMAYSIAATATLAYVLLLLLFLPNPPNRRPWLQKVATLTVCICLTIAFVETTDVLHAEYDVVGSSVYSLTNEARMVRSRVVAGLVMRIGRVVSDLFLWLAQVQTLIRLFPREREKVIIKWAGFGLILLDTLFSILQSFVSPLASTDSFLDAIPALSYLFQISLSLLYACCVLYYSFAKRRYSYFYPSRPFSPSSPGTKQYGGRSIILVAVLSIASVVTPIVFFIVDIAQKDLAGWGDYIRWVGAASASVVVWEWVDRIEGLEREEGKGGVLGREVYEEDDDD